MALSISLWVCQSHVTFMHSPILVKIKNVKNDVCRLWHLSSNFAIAKILIHDRDLLFEDKKIKTSISLKQLELVQKCMKRLLYILIFVTEEKHCKIVLYDRNLLFEGKQFEMLISQTPRELAQKCTAQFLTDFDICYQMAALGQFYSVTLTYLLKVNNVFILLRLILLSKKNCDGNILDWIFQMKLYMIKNFKT